MNGADPDGNESEFGEHAGHCLVDGSVDLGVGDVTGGPLGAGIGFAIGCGVGAVSYYTESHGASEVGETVDGVEDLRELQEISKWLNE